MAGTTAAAKIPSAPVARGSQPHFVHGLAIGLVVSMLIWAMIALAVYELT